MGDRLPARRGVPGVPGVPGVIVASPAAGTGKTTVTLGLLAALRARGVAVAAAKTGPGLAAPAWHAAVTGRPCYNLDGWAMAPALLDRVIGRAGEGAELLLCDGWMGLFDGPDGTGAAGDGSTADLARHSGWPVLLVVDGRGMAQSAAALVQGFAHHRPDVRIAGVVFNSVTDGHTQRRAVAAVAALGVPVLGTLPDDPDIALPALPRGALPDATTAAAARLIDSLGRLLSANVDLDRLLALALPARRPAGRPGAPPLPPPGQRIAVAHDAAFGRLYPHILDGWRAAGAELVLFSPLADEAPPAYADAVYLPGGAPDRHAPALAGARRFHEGLHALARRGPVYGEGGGYAVLGEVLDTGAGAFPMAGLLGVRTDARRAPPGAGHRRARLLADHPFAPAGTVFAAHDGAPFAVADPGLDDALFAVTDADGRDAGRCGSRRGPVSGSPMHLLA
ncbi:cobyrinate a,c-diamide synthase [Azospirillum sp. A39]|uniref:cobyrinate a,c-diamide synthase n=1 Tax=Azospirillum sp. A39 TaxID=3462279 RepID=UPI0040464163